MTEINKLDKALYWKITGLIRIKDSLKQAVYKHLFDGVTLQDAGLELGVSKQSIYQVKKRIFDLHDKLLEVQKLEQKNSAKKRN